MGKDRNDSPLENSDEEMETPSNPKSKSKSNSESEPEDSKHKSHGKSDKGKRPSKSRKRHSSEEDDSHSDSESESESDYSDSESEYSSSEEERRRRKRKRREREERERKRRRKEKEKKRRRKEKERDEERKRKKRKEKERKEKKKKEKLERGKKGAVTNSWGKYGVIRETDMWNKRPEFTAWLAEVKQINLESLPNWEEKQLFKEFMEDHNTATFPSKKYYNLDAYYKRKMEKDMKKGVKKVLDTERTVFNDEEQRRQELLIAREKQKEEQVESLKRAMQSGMAQAMKEQAQLREEMAYQYKIGNFEAAAAIQRRLDPDVAM
ncbi:vicilin-like seed storage protein At2g18540 [Durio zibethinus]|uniref:Vicilin-like seed storage protein At2g18540 n=1 Tax=Durio zibethinus TaxID=66656 RepID=A0A6P5WNQ1_DURZI|nr:vicilin-like seed storage protein At2g18540 [Durio zibethinus]